MVSPSRATVSVTSSSGRYPRMVATIRGYRPDDEVTLTVVRDGETIEVEATLDSDEGQQQSQGEENAPEPDLEGLPSPE